MNKYQFRAVSTAILALCTSFAVWTVSLGKLPLPRISESTVTMVQGIIDDLFVDLYEAQEITVQQVTVESLGTHYAKTVHSTSVRASVIPNAVVTQQPIEEPQDEPEPAHEEPEPVHESAPEETELQQWELMRAWNIVIPSLSIRAPVLLPSMKYWSTQAWDLLEEQMQIGLNHGTVAYPHSATPGNNGSLIIAGHSSPPDERAETSSYGNVFAKLPEIAVGEEIEVQAGGATVRYVVEDKVIVSPKTTTILEQQYDGSKLKLITCYPVGTTRNRMIITASKIDD